MARHTAIRGLNMVASGSITLALALITATLAGHVTHAAAATGCDRVAAPGGSDAMPGTEAQPVRSAQALVDSLAPGETGCLRAGTYSVGEKLRLRTPEITLTSFPGEWATVQGRVRVETSADGATIARLMLDGRNPENLVSPLIYADRFVLRDNEITNDHTAICVHVDAYGDDRAPRGVVVTGNRIHDCGRLPATNHSHGIYIAEANRTIIRRNWIYSNADRGIQLYPDADGSIVTGNVIDGNGQGVIFGGDEDSSSDNNLVANNVITNSNIRYNVESHWQGPTGRGNVARNNCVFGGARPDNGGIERPPDGFVALANVVAPPAYLNPAAGDFRLRSGSSCRGGRNRVRGSSAPDRLVGSASPDVLIGVAKGDRLIGRGANDRLSGGGGSDRLHGGEGADLLRGGAGRDRLRARDGHRDRVLCGRGRDVASVDRQDVVRGCERERG